MPRLRRAETPTRPTGDAVLSRFSLPCLATLFALCAAVLGGCAHRSADSPVADAAPSPGTAAPTVPVVLVPGITGSELIDPETDKVVWGLGSNLIRPKDHGYTLVRPLTEPIAEAARDLRAGDVLSRVRLGPVKKEIYGPVFSFLEGAGYRFGDLEAPRPSDSLFAFAYDWRGDNILAAARLRQLLDDLADGWGDGYEVDLVCQSNGAHICRYLLKYGGATLEVAEAGRAGPPERFRIRKLILVGTSNGGALRILREVDRGRRYVPWIGRRMEAEVLFSFPSIFQDLPAHLEKPFIDPSGRPVDLDLFDADTWVDRGWSVFRGEARARMASRPDLFGDDGAREAYLREVLDRARRLHRLLAADVDAFPGSRYFLVQNGYEPTPHLAIVGLDGNALSFTGDDVLEDHPYLDALASRPGDGHASLPSQMALSPQERAAVAQPVFYVEAEHFQVIIQPETLRRLLDFLDE
ncbi:MAG: hypothetical protein AAGF23_04380 [Acidobacteriota bacterium]